MLDEYSMKARHRRDMKVERGLRQFSRLGMTKGDTFNARPNQKSIPIAIA